MTHFFQKRNQKQKAFTLLEVLVAFMVMAFVMTSVLSAMQSFVVTSRTLSLVREMQKEAHFSLIRLSDKIRNESIDFTQYSDGGMCDGLSLNLNEKICLGSGYFVLYDSDQQNIFMGKGPGEPAPLFSPSVIVKEAMFEVSPDKNPDDPENWGDQLYQRQPLVTLRLVLQSRKNTKLELDLETSISSRVYR